MQNDQDTRKQISRDRPTNKTARFPCTRSIVDRASRRPSTRDSLSFFSYRKPDAHVGRAPRRLENSNTLFLCRPVIPSSPLSRAPVATDNHRVSFLRWSMVPRELSHQHGHLPAGRGYKRGKKSKGGRDGRAWETVAIQSSRKNEKRVDKREKKDRLHTGTHVEETRTSHNLSCATVRRHETALRERLREKRGAVPRIADSTRRAISRARETDSVRGRDRVREVERTIQPSRER